MERGPGTFLDNRKDRLNNSKTNCEPSFNLKCDISNRKRITDDTLLSCIVVNNDLHGKNENKNLMPINASKATSVARSASSHNNR